ncbi:hypothetical protein B0H12DRAFT_272650 [Mycena haematopus]|nr:hypothetical protein B0H12DRAFT_272650 [Mycena haematopus]
MTQIMKMALKNPPAEYRVDPFAGGELGTVDGAETAAALPMGAPAIGGLVGIAAGLTLGYMNGADDTAGTDDIAGADDADGMALGALNSDCVTGSSEDDTMSDTDPDSVGVESVDGGPTSVVTLAGVSVGVGVGVGVGVAEVTGAGVSMLVLG